MSASVEELRSSHPEPQRARWLQRFSLTEDKADDAEIERRIRDGVELIGATPWILIFAILIASVGLNVNSTAVIIGAMLISPLMGPIMGAGLGVAIYDFALVKRALISLIAATAISLAVSTGYFLLTPLQEVRSELLARTTPTLWDVLIALFGGLAGAVGVTRQEKSNVIPGVAIATALMPPVCTAGFGLATRRWDFVGGALYLYTINCVFIGIATVIGMRAVKLKSRAFADGKTQFRVQLTLYALALSTALPSGYLAASLVNEEIFSARARRFVEQELSSAKTHVAESKIDPKSKTVEVFLVGAVLDDKTLKGIEAKLGAAELDGAQLVVHQAEGHGVDITALRSSVLSDLYIKSQEALTQRDEAIRQLKQDASSREALLASAPDMVNELKAQYPQIKQVLISEGLAFTPGQPEPHKVAHLSVTLDKPLGADAQARIRQWFQVRTKVPQFVVQFDRVGR